MTEATLPDLSVWVNESKNIVDSFLDTNSNISASKMNTALLDIITLHLRMLSSESKEKVSFFRNHAEKSIELANDAERIGSSALRRVENEKVNEEWRKAEQIFDSILGHTQENVRVQSIECMKQDYESFQTYKINSRSSNFDENLKSTIHTLQNTVDSSQSMKKMFDGIQYEIANSSSNKQSFSSFPSIQPMIRPSTVPFISATGNGSRSKKDSLDNKTEESNIYLTQLAKSFTTSLRPFNSENSMFVAFQMLNTDILERVIFTYDDIATNNLLTNFRMYISLFSSPKGGSIASAEASSIETLINMFFHALKTVYHLHTLSNHGETSIELTNVEKYISVYFTNTDILPLYTAIMSKIKIQPSISKNTVGLTSWKDLKQKMDSMKLSLDEKQNLENYKKNPLQIDKIKKSMALIKLGHDQSVSFYREKRLVVMEGQSVLQYETIYDMIQFWLSFVTRGKLIPPSDEFMHRTLLMTEEKMSGNNNPDLILSPMSIESTDSGIISSLTIFEANDSNSLEHFSPLTFALMRQLKRCNTTSLDRLEPIIAIPSLDPSLMGINPILNLEKKSVEYKDINKASSENNNSMFPSGPNYLGNLFGITLSTASGAIHLSSNVINFVANKSKNLTTFDMSKLFSVTYPAASLVLFDIMKITIHLLKNRWFGKVNCKWFADWGASLPKFIYAPDNIPLFVCSIYHLFQAVTTRLSMNVELDSFMMEIAKTSYESLPSAPYVMAFLMVTGISNLYQKKALASGNTHSLKIYSVVTLLSLIATSWITSPGIQPLSAPLMKIRDALLSGLGVIIKTFVGTSSNNFEERNAVLEQIMNEIDTAENHDELEDWRTKSTTEVNELFLKLSRIQYTTMQQAVFDDQKPIDNKIYTTLASITLTETHNECIRNFIALLEEGNNL